MTVAGPLLTHLLLQGNLLTATNEQQAGFDLGDLQEILQPNKSSKAKRQKSIASTSIPTLADSTQICAAANVEVIDIPYKQDLTTDMPAQMDIKVLNPSFFPTMVQLTGEQYCYTAAQMENLLQVYFKVAPPHVFQSMLDQMTQSIDIPRSDLFEEKYQTLLKDQLVLHKQNNALIKKTQSLQTELQRAKSEVHSIQEDLKKVRKSHDFHTE